MADGIRFTDHMSMTVKEIGEVTAIIELDAPVSVWLRLDSFELVGGLKPTFYLDVTNVTHHVRGAIEAACEEAWDIFMDIFHDGPGPHQDTVLPLCHMRTGMITTSRYELGLTAKRLRSIEEYAPHRELALIAEGFEKVLEEGI